MGLKLSSDSALRLAFQNHSRTWREFLYVYPVVSRRSRGLSIGINLNPDMACNFDCVYCQVDRSQPPAVRQVDLAVVEAELRALLMMGDKIFTEPEFADIPDPFKRLSDFAFSGDGEPTAATCFPEAARLVAKLRSEFGCKDASIVIITDACFLTRPKVTDTLDFLSEHGGEVWAKLDAGTEEYFKAVDRSKHSLAHVLNEITTTAKRRPLVIQSLFMRLHDEPPSEAEITAYVDRLREIASAGGTIKYVQIYTVARGTAEDYVTKLTADELEAIASQVHAAGLTAEVYP